MTRRSATGRAGEELAASHLRSLGYEIVCTNWRCRSGEIDLVARDGSCLAIVEVRAKRSRLFGSPEESIGYRKRAKLRHLGLRYVQQTGWRGDWRIDVVAVEFEADGSLRRLTHYPSAIEGGAA